MIYYKNSKVFGFVCMGFAFVMFSHVAVGDLTTEAEGRGLSETAALMDAKRNAVEQGIGTLLISQTEIENFKLKKDYILTRTVGAVHSLEVLSKAEQPDASWVVKIRAVVSTRDIKEDLVSMQILLESMSKPRLMVLMDEPDPPTVETTLVRYLTDKGFSVVDKGIVSSVSGVVDNNKLAAQAGQQGGAEYVVMGRATKTAGEGAYGMASGQVALSARIVNCSTANVIASKSETASFAHLNREIALAKASEQVANTLIDDTLFEKLIASFQDQVNNGMPLELVVMNVKKYKMQKQIKSLLETFPGMVSVTRRSFKKGTLSLSLVYKGTADFFCEELDEQSVGRGLLMVTDVAGSRVVAEWQP